MRVRGPRKRPIEWLKIRCFKCSELRLRGPKRGILESVQKAKWTYKLLFSRIRRFFVLSRNLKVAPVISKKNLFEKPRVCFFLF